MRIDVSRIAPQIPMQRGAAGEKAITLFDADGRSLAVAHDFGERRQAIVGSTDGAVLFPVLPADPRSVYARLADVRPSLRPKAVDLTSTLQAARPRAPRS